MVGLEERPVVLQCNIVPNKVVKEDRLNVCCPNRNIKVLKMSDPFRMSRQRVRIRGSVEEKNKEQKQSISPWRSDSVQKRALSCSSPLSHTYRLEIVSEEKPSSQQT